MEAQPCAMLPALLATADTVPGLFSLNGRRVAAQQTLRMWSQFAPHKQLNLAVADASLNDRLQQIASSHGFCGNINFRSILRPHAFSSCGAIFIPDLDIGKWSNWRQEVGSSAFSIIGQIHTLSSRKALHAIERLADQNLQNWDALICSSTAGRDVVCQLIDTRRELMRSQYGASRFPQIQTPVIPLPLSNESFGPFPHRLEARKLLGIKPDALVFLWVGRLSILTKADPWPGYRFLQEIARQVQQPVYLIECGPDDTQSHQKHYSELRALVPEVSFLRLGDHRAVDCGVKKCALAAADIGFSIVDNIQETFGLSVAEFMAAGLPVIASNWDGYRDLVRDEIDGCLIPTRWYRGAGHYSRLLSWQHELELITYEIFTGALAQLVTVDWKSSLNKVLQWISDPTKLTKSGQKARERSEQLFSEKSVMAQYVTLFSGLAAVRPVQRHSSQVQQACYYDAIKLFSDYASVSAGSLSPDSEGIKPEALVLESRKSILQSLCQDYESSNQKNNCIDNILCTKHV